MRPVIDTTFLEGKAEFWNERWCFDTVSSWKLSIKTRRKFNLDTYDSGLGHRRR